jgi:hypothetical protein
MNSEVSQCKADARVIFAKTTKARDSRAQIYLDHASAMFPTTTSNVILKCPLSLAMYSHRFRRSRARTFSATTKRAWQR